jgi:hypothetical protein
MTTICARKRKATLLGLTGTFRGVKGKLGLRKIVNHRTGISAQLHRRARLFGLIAEDEE